MPKLAMAMNEGTINEWLVAEGQHVEAGTPIAVIETEKVAYDCESPESGYFLPVVADGETVDVEVLIGCFCTEEAELVEARARYLTGSNGAADPESGTVAVQETATMPAPESPEPASPKAAGGSSRRIKASPAARKLARTEAVELADVVGTGPGGRIVKRDVKAHLERMPSQPSAANSAVLARTPMKGLRRTIAARMSDSLAESAQVSGHFEADLTRLLAIRARFVERAEQLGTRVSVNAFLIKAIATAIARVPQVNACVEADDIIVYRNVNMGIATSLPGQNEYDSALVVAVLRNVEQMGVATIDREMKALLARVRDGKARPEDLRGSTITLSSTAGIGPPGLTSTPVLNRPNVFMLGPSTPIERIRHAGGEYVSATMLPMSYTFDHRAIDGEPTARFLGALNEIIEEPELMLA
jgi:pyruvate/2-oxoglutarate dehydrogenase complex dihydrolipoamide acyltransferase (E2) component